MMLRKYFFVVCLGTLAGASLGHSQSLVNIDFQSGGDPTASGAAVLGSDGDQWNGIDGSSGGTIGPLSLFDNLGNASSVNVTFTCDGAVPAASPPSQPVPDLTHDYIFDNSGGAITVQLSGLLADHGYLLVLYVASDDASGGDRSLSGTVDGFSTTPFTATGDPQPSFVNGENVVELNVLSDASGTLNITEGMGANNSSGEVDLAGLQLQSAPEPASMTLLGIGAMALIARRKRLS